MRSLRSISIRDCVLLRAQSGLLASLTASHSTHTTLPIDSYRNLTSDCLSSSKTCFPHSEARAGIIMDKYVHLVNPLTFLTHEDAGDAWWQTETLIE